MTSKAWRVETIGSLIDEGMITVHKDGNHGSNYPRTSEFGSTGIPFLTAKLLDDAGNIDLDNAPRLSESKANSFTFGFIESGDVLLSHNATVGRVAVVPELKERVLIGTSLTHFRLDKSRLLPRYLAAFFTGKDFQNQLAAVMSQTTRNQVPITAQRHLTVVVPPVEDQKAIADTVGSFDEKIELNRKQNRTLEAITQALFKRWFVEFEFPDENGRPYQSSGGAMQPSELGEIPMGWQIGALGDVVEQRIERVASSQETRDMPYVPIDCISPASLLLQESKDGEEAQSSLIRFYENDILFGAMRPYFHKVCIAPFAGTTRTTCFVLKPRSSDDFAYGALLLHDAGTIDFATKHSTGSTIPYAKWESSLDTMEIVLPPPIVRKDFNELVYPLLSRIPPRYFENQSLAQIRDALLPKLMSGELRMA